jgi:hypothetical protein
MESKTKSAAKPARDFTEVDRRLRQILEPLRSRFLGNQGHEGSTRQASLGSAAMPPAGDIDEH